jgi:hypothetical protein
MITEIVGVFGNLFEYKVLKQKDFFEDIIICDAGKE